MEPKPISDPKIISDISPIEQSTGIDIRTREDLAVYVEEPLLLACQTLYDLNIRTIASSANGANLGNASIAIDFDTLSDLNQEIGSRLGTVSEPHHGGRWLLLEREVTAETPVVEIQDWSVNLAEQFQRQSMTWATFYTLEQIIEYQMTTVDDPIEEIEKAYGFYYDPDNRVFFLSEEQARKFKEDLAVDWDASGS